MKSQVDIISLLSSFDWFIFFLIALITVASVFWGQKIKKKGQTEEESFVDLMLMGRQLTLPMFVATLVATWYGGIFGVSQIAFESGIFNFVIQGLFWYVSYFIFAFFITKKIQNFEAMTLPDLVGQMFGPKSAKLSALLNFVNLIPIAYAISMGLFIKMLFGYELYLSVTIGIGFVLAYSTFGGFRAVVFSDIIQFFVMCSSVIGIFILSVWHFGFDPLTTLPDRYFDPTGGYGILSTLSWGLIAVSTLVDPNFYQRTFAAKSLDTAKKGIIISTFIWFIFDISLTFGAMYAKATIPEADSQYGYFIYAIQLLPDGARGFVLAGIAATVLSTLDSYIFLAGSTLAYDLVPKRFKGKISVHHLGIVSVGILSILFSLVVEGNIKNVWKTLGSLSSSSLLVPIMMGHLYPRRFKDIHFLTSAISGAVSAFIWRLSGLKEAYQLDEIYIGVLASLIGFMFVKITLKETR